MTVDLTSPGAPTVSVVDAPTAQNQYQALLAISADDPQSGIARYEITVVGCTVQPPLSVAATSPQPITVAACVADGTSELTLTVRAINGAGSPSASTTLTLPIQAPGRSADVTDPRQTTPSASNPAPPSIGQLAGGGCNQSSRPAGPAAVAGGGSGSPAGPDGARP